MENTLRINTETQRLETIPANNTNFKEIKVTTLGNENEDINQNQKRLIEVNMCFLIFLTLNSSMGFFFFGYNLVVFNTMQENISTILNWNSSNKNIFISIISAILPLGSILGCNITGKITSMIGRRNSFFIFNLVGIISCLITVISNSYALIIGKLIQGICVGAFSTLVPLYINEYSPNHLSGMLGITYNTNFCIGILVGFALGLNLPDINDVHDNWWRFMFLFPSIPCFVNIILNIFVFNKDTPKYLIMNGKNQEAIYVLNKIYINEKDTMDYVKEIENSLKQINDVSYNEICCQSYSKRTFIIIILNVFQQLTFINGIGLYSNMILLQNADKFTSTIFTFFIGLSELIGSLLTIFFIEKFGRRFIAIGGYFLTFLLHLISSILYFYDYSIPQRYIFIFFYFLCGISIDPIIWIYNSDVLPDRGVGIATMTNWTTAVVVIVVFPFLMNSGAKLFGTFLITSLFSLTGGVFSYFFMVETRNKFPSEIASDFETKRFCN